MAGAKIVAEGGVTVSADNADSRSWKAGQSFAVDRSDIGNTGEASRLSAELDSLYKEGLLESVTIEGTASPEGRSAYNSRLALRRAESMRDFICGRTDVPESMFMVRSAGEDWKSLLPMLGDCLTPAQVDAVSAIIDTESDLDLREKNLRRLDGGAVWSRMLTELFPHLRKSTVTAMLKSGGKVTYTLDSAGASETVVEPPQPEPAPEPEVQPVEIPVAEEPVIVEETVVEEVVVVEPAPVEPEPVADVRHWYLKTNIPAWGMLWSNIQAELDVARNWSVMLPVYYSGWNYFTSTRKFRTFTVMPEVRYWLRPDNQGFFVGAHAGFCYYNVAFGGAKRYQDHNKRTPALGGGVNVGYRMPISRNGRWHLEFSIGAGVYSLDYDTFENRHNGLLTGREHDTFFGIDNAAISLCYRFDILRKGGAR